MIIGFDTKIIAPAKAYKSPTNAKYNGEKEGKIDSKVLAAKTLPININTKRVFS